MSDLAASSSLADWTAAYASYDERILTHSKTGKRRAKLVALDEFVRNDIPTRLEARLANDSTGGASKRPDGYLTKEEVCKIVEWKITVCSLCRSGPERIPIGSSELSRSRLPAPRLRTHASFSEANSGETGPTCAYSGAMANPFMPPGR